MTNFETLCGSRLSRAQLKLASLKDNNASERAKKKTEKKCIFPFAELTNRKRDQGVLAFLADAPPVDAVVSAIRKRGISLNLILRLSSTLASVN